MLAKEYRLKSARSPEFLIGYARQIEVDDTYIRLRGRCIPISIFEKGHLVQVPQKLPDVEFPIETWAVWTYDVEVGWLDEPIIRL